MSGQVGQLPESFPYDFVEYQGALLLIHNFDAVGVSNN
jgi:hypothetical protein